VRIFPSHTVAVGGWGCHSRGNKLMLDFAGLAVDLC